VFRSSVDPGSRFVVRELLPANVVASGQKRQTDARCRVRWTMDFDMGHERFELDGAIDGNHGANRPIRHEPEHDGIDLEAVLRSWARGPLAASGRWDESQRRLAVRFDGLTAEEQEGFQKSVTLPMVEVAGRGAWKNVTLEGVAIGPANTADATRWAMARLDRRLRGERRYRTRGDVLALFTSLTETTALESHAPSLAPHEQLLGTYATTPAVFWSLAAPADLDPNAHGPMTEAVQ